MDSALPARADSAALWGSLGQAFAGVAVDAPARVPGVLAAVIPAWTRPPVASCPCGKPNTGLTGGLKAVGKTINLVQKAKHHRFTLNGQVWRIVTLEVRHAVSAQ